MKNIFLSSLILFCGLGLNAQELVPNGGMEEWEWTGSNYVPYNWGVSIPASGGYVESSDVRYFGLKSAMVDAPNGAGYVRLYLEEDINVVPGQQYTFSYWYDDSFGGAKLRHYASFRDANGVEIDYALDLLQPESVPDTEGWEDMVIVLTAPANAAKFRLDFRVYEDVPSEYDVIYIDEISFKGGNMSINDLEASNIYVTTVWSDQATFSTKGNATVEIFNLNGQLVQKANGMNNFTISVSGLAKDLYVVKVRADGKVLTQKVVKK